MTLPECVGLVEIFATTIFSVETHARLYCVWVGYDDYVTDKYRQVFTILILMQIFLRKHIELKKLNIPANSLLCDTWKNVQVTKPDLSN